DPAARLPRRRRRLDLHLLADPWRLHHAQARLQQPVHRQRRLQQLRHQPAAGLGLRPGPDRGHDRLPAGRPQAGRLRAHLDMRLSRRSALLLRLAVGVALATFCIVVVYNNVVARLRRASASFEEASADLGAHTWQTFRFVTLPNLRTALAAGALLAFALSFDEIIVTTFTLGAGEETLPIWIFRNLFRPNQLPIVNAVAVIVVLISIIPVYLAHRLTREEGGAAAARGGGKVEAEATAVP